MEKDTNIPNSKPSEKMEVMTIKLGTDYGYDSNYTFTLGREKFIKFGEDNLMPIHNIKLRQAPTHNSILDLKADLASGSGLMIPKDNIKLQEFVDFNNLNWVIRKIEKDLVTHGGFSLDIGWDSTGSYISEVNFMDFAFLRKENELKPKNYYTCYDWANYRKYDISKTITPEFNPALASTQLNQFYYFADIPQGAIFYPKPDYSGIRFIEFEVLLGEFSFNNMSNGMSPSGIFNFKEVPTEQERQMIKASIRNDLSGPCNSGKFLALFAEDETKAVEFIPLSVDNNASIYNTLNDLAVQKIITGHRLSSPALAGAPSSGSIVFGNELSTSYEYFYNLVIPKYRTPVLDIMNKIFRINKLIQPNEYIQIKNLMPGQFKYDGNILGNSLYINEVRKDLGLEPVKDGEQFVLPRNLNQAPPNQPNQLPPTQTMVNDISKMYSDISKNYSKIKNQ